MALAWHDANPSPPPRRGRFFDRDRQGSARVEPKVAIPKSAIESWSNDETNVVSLFDIDQPLGHRPGDASDVPQPKPAASPSRFWRAAVVTSCLLHLAVAAAFIQFATDEVLIEGGEHAQVALLGNAPEDQLSAGNGPDAADPDVTSVTLVTMLDAKPVETVEAALVPVESAEAVEAADAVEPADEADAVALLPEPVDAVEPVRPDAVQQPVASVPVQPTRPDEAQQSAAVLTPTAPVDEAEPVSLVAASPYAEVLTAERLVPVDDARETPLSSEAPSQDLAQAVKAIPAEPFETAKAAPVAPANEARQVDEVAVLVPVEQAPQPERIEPAATLAPVAEEPAEKPVKTAEAKPSPSKKPEPKIAKPEKPKAKPAKPKAEAKAKTKKAAKAAPARSGSKGSNHADARRGEADGAADGRSTANSKGARKSTAAGNAAVSNYPGKIVSKLRRALRYPAAAKRKGLRGEVQVAFTVSAGGGIGSVRVVRSSGSPILDKAAIDTVRRAAPFPAIPAGAGRSSWPFTVPLAFTR